MKQLSKEEAINLLKADAPRNAAILHLLVENHPQEIHQAGSSIIIRHQSDVFASSQDPEELACLVKLLSPKSRFISSVEPWMVPILKRGYKADWELTLPRYILPLETSLPQKTTQNIGPLSPEFAPLVSSKWAHGGDDEDSREYIKSRLEKGLSAAVYIDQQPVAWVATHDDGSLGFAYCLEEYRQRGYARDLTIHLARQQRERGIPSIVNIAPDNQASMALAMSLGFVQNGDTSWLNLAIPCQAPCKISQEQALAVLQEDINKNLPFLRFMENKHPREVWQSGKTIMALFNGTVYISCHNPGELDCLLEKLTSQDIFFAALDPELAPKIKAAKGSPSYEEVLGKYFLPMDTPLPEPKHHVVPLPGEYAPLVDQHWTLSSHDEGSLDYVRSRLENGPTAAVFQEGRLVGWCATHSDHAPGFIYVEEEHRSQGIALDLTISIIQQQRALGYPSYISIADNNLKSQAVAKKLGFTKTGHLLWLGFDKMGHPGTVPDCPKVERW